ncbi:AGAP007237-PB [Paramuricea clavata]|uniref:AGAP007237-PB, partial n=1 Tax=Paramuricea clavata TaxID=317549 RepID=A0A7D9IZ53_PARCT|nr:AGAP007237-PB [Paramuricea clavata]
MELAGLGLVPMAHNLTGVFFYHRCNGSSSDFVCPCYPIIPDADAACIRITRSAAVCQKHGYPKPREQINVNTAFIDASQIYGSTKRVADSLRQTKPEDRGLLKSSRGLDGELLPLDPSLEAEEQLCNNLGGCFVAGDSRSNEQQSLAAFHSLFLREHNRIAKTLKDINNHWNGEKVYQETRRIMGAVMQKITYLDFLPLVLGPNPLPRYRGYRRDVRPGISGSFATSAFRYGHSLIRPAFDILDTGFNRIGNPIGLRFMFFNNTFIQRNGINPLLLGLIGNFSENVDRILSSGVTRHLFERENSPGLNLAAINIQRSRDHGIPGYNHFRKLCGLKNAKTFADTKNEIRDPKNIQILKRLYDNPDIVDLWVAGLAETPVNGASVGPTFQCIIGDQFRRTRDGDRFYFERKRVWRRDQLAEIKKVSLSSMYCNNLNVTSIQPNAFVAPTDTKPRINCERIPDIDLCKWKENPYFRRHPCVNGKLVSKNGKCICECKSPWFGNRCESKPRTKVSWLATILNSKKEIVCSGALIRPNHDVLTTASCAKAASKNGYVQLGDYRKVATIAIKSIKKVNQDFSIIILPRKIHKNAYFIGIARVVSTLRPTAVTVWGSGQFPDFVWTKVARRRNTVCKRKFNPLNSRKEFCTLPAGLPAITKRSGSPLVQYYLYQPYLVGLLTEVADSSSSGARFGKYVKVTHLRFSKRGRWW